MVLKEAMALIYESSKKIYAGRKRLAQKAMTAMLPLALCAFFVSESFAAEVPPSNVRGDAGIQMNRMRDYLEREKVARQIEEDRAAAKKKVERQEEKQEKSGEEITFAVKKISTDPSQVLSEEEVRAITSPFEGREISLGDLYKVVDKFNELYAAKGFLTCRAFLPPQTIEQGVVKILLVEGRTGNVALSGNKYTKSKYISSRLRIAKDEVANIKELNRDLLRFNAGNSTQLRVVMKAGQEPGTTDYEITAYEPKRDTWTMFEDNAGSYASNQYRTGLFFNTKSLTGNCDAFGMGVVRSQGMKAMNATYSRSLGHSGTKLNLLYSANSVRVVEGDFEDKLKGHASAYAIGLVQPLLVNETTRSELSLDYNRSSSATDWTQGARFNIARDRVQDFTLGYALTNYGASHVFYQKHAYVRGFSESDPEAFAYASQNFGFYKFNALYQKLYAAGQMWTLRGDAQWSGSEGMASSRQYYIGGMYSVRGYKENFLGGDSGFAFSAEYAVPVLARGTNAFAFFDYGHVYGNGQSDDQHAVLASVGAGLRSQLNDYLSAQFVLGVPLQREFSSEDAGKLRLHFLVSGQY